MGIVEAMTEQIAPIHAEERLQMISDTAAAVGSAKKGAASSHVRNLRRQADYKQPATATDLGMIGIKVVHHGH